MLYLYAVVERDANLPDQPGIGGERVTLVPVDGLGAVVGEVPGEIEPSDREVLAHARVVDGLAAANDAVLPARFGRGFRDDAELESSLARLASRLENRLRSVSGCVEIGLHVVGERETEVAATSGREYMQRRLREHAHLEAVADEIHSPLAEQARDARRSSAGSGALLRAAYLVERDRVDDFRDGVAAVAERHPELAFSCTGPWAPYSFASFEEASA